MVEPHSSNFRVITTIFLGVRIFRKITVVAALGEKLLILGLFKKKVKTGDIFSPWSSSLYWCIKSMKRLKTSHPTTTTECNNYPALWCMAVNQKILSHSMTKQTKWHVHPAILPISLGIPQSDQSSMCTQRMGGLGPKVSSCGYWRLDSCPGWSESLLGAHDILLVLLCCGSNVLWLEIMINYCNTSSLNGMKLTIPYCGSMNEWFKILLGIARQWMGLCSIKVVEDVYFFEVNTKYISSNV